jgi:hypothetical protein
MWSFFPVFPYPIHRQIISNALIIPRKYLLAYLMLIYYAIIRTEENQLICNLSYQRWVKETEYINLQAGQQSQVVNLSTNKNFEMTQQ